MTHLVTLISANDIYKSADMAILMKDDNGGSGIATGYGIDFGEYIDVEDPPRL